MWRKRKPSSPASCARSGLISSFLTSAASRGVTWVSSGASAWTAPRWKISPSIAPRSSTLRSAGSSWSRRAASSACSVGGTATSPADSPAIASISSMKSGFPAAARAIRSRSSATSCAGMSSSTSSAPSGSRRRVTGQAGCRSTSSGRAMQSSRIDAPEESSATCSIRSRSISSPHWMSSRTTTSGRLAATCSSVLRKAQAISSAVVAASLSPSSERITAAASSSAGSSSSCFSTSTTGQYVIPSPYGRHRPRTTVASTEAKTSATSRDLPTPASPTTVTSSQQPVDTSALRRRSDQRQLALTTDEPRPVPALPGPQHSHEPVGGNGRGLPLQHERLDGRRLDGLANERKSRLPDEHLARLRRLLQPCSHVHGIARCQALVRAGDDLARHDADPALQPEPGQRLPHLDGGSHRPQRVVLVDDRHAEHGHDRVTDELLHGAAVPTRRSPSSPRNTGRAESAAARDRAARRAPSSR